jgi:cytochrome d ubiquinol oxidase subunit I
VPFTVAAVATPLQVIVGDWAGKFLATNEPTKLAAIEGVYRTGTHVPLSIGGVYYGDQMHYAIEIPGALSFLAHWNTKASLGLNKVPAADPPPVNIVHWSFDLMVALGFALFALGCRFRLTWWRRHRLPDSRWFLRGAAWSGVAAVLALELGWVTTEVGRQPWIAWGVLRTADAVTPVPGLLVGLTGVTVVYVLLTVGTVYVLRRLVRSAATEAPQEPEHDARVHP